MLLSTGCSPTLKGLGVRQLFFGLLLTAHFVIAALASTMPVYNTVLYLPDYLPEPLSPRGSQKVSLIVDNSSVQSTAH